MFNNQSRTETRSLLSFHIKLESWNVNARFLQYHGRVSNFRHRPKSTAKYLVSQKLVAGKSVTKTHQKSVTLNSLATFHLKTLFLWFAEYISQVGSSGDGSMIIIRDCHYTSAEAGLKVQIFADTKEDTELDDYAEEFTYGLADAIEQIEGRILL